MNLKQQYLTKNDCYKAGKKIKVKGLMLHSTGGNNPKLSRYVQPDDGFLGDNPNNNDWNQPDISKCVHGFIGLDKKGQVKTYQTLPWDHRGWHAGGSANDTHIGVEICEDDLKDPDYFHAVYEEAVELFAFLCKKFKLDPEKDITTHCDGYKDGIASNHGDVMHWFPKHGKTMNTFRADVKKELKKEATTSTKPEVSKPEASKPVVTKPASKTIDQLAQEVIDGKHGSGAEREKSLGSKFDAVQKRVNEILADEKKPAPKPKEKTIDQLAKEVIDGKHGSGAAREKSLGSKFDAVQKRVNEILSKPKEKTISQLADEVIKGLHGSGRERMLSLGSKYAAVQKEVTKRMR